MNGKLWPIIALIPILIFMFGWMVYLERNKADKLETQDRWTGSLMDEFKEGQEGKEQLRRELDIAYKASIAGELSAINEKFSEELKEINAKLDILMGERGTDSRGSESE